MPDRSIITLPALDSGAIPIHIVELELNNFRLRVSGENFVQEGGIVVVGEANFSDLSLLFQFPQECKFIVSFAYFIILLVQPVKQIHIEKIHATAFALHTKIPLTVLCGMYHPRGQLIRDLEAVSGMSLHYGVPKGNFALPVQIGVRSVKICAAPLQKGIDHLI